MSTSAVEVLPRASRVRCTDFELVVAFDDGRTLSVPLVWFPRLLDATAEQRANSDSPARERASIGKTWTRTCPWRDSCGERKSAADG